MRDHRARRRFSQNFLHDSAVVSAIVAAVGVAPEDHVVEIGPGLGALTEPLAALAGRFDLVEIDRDLAGGLREQFADRPHVHVHEHDALRFDLADIASAPHRLRVVGNLPYNISTPLLFRLIEQRALIRDMLLMLQEEVVARLTAEPGSHAYGRLGVMCSLWCEAERVMRVGPGAFRPAPKVHSAVVHLRVREQPAVAVDDETAFARIVAAAFGQRRKTLRNALRTLLPAETIEACSVDPTARAETLGLESFAALANALSATQAQPGS